MKNQPLLEAECTFQEQDKQKQSPQFSPTRCDGVSGAARLRRERRRLAVCRKLLELLGRVVSWIGGDDYLRPNLLYMEKLV